MMITKQTKDPQNLDYLSGQVILVDKPVNWTSFDVVARIRRLTKVKKVGHAGTLDPLATGLLIVCTGKKTKEISSYQEQRKKYTGIITLGKSSPSMDLATEISEKPLPDNLTEENILSVINKFLGNIEQVPPMFSAIKHKGKALYKLARAGKVVERDSRAIHCIWPMTCWVWAYPRSVSWEISMSRMSATLTPTTHSSTRAGSPHPVAARSLTKTN